MVTPATNYTRNRHAKLASFWISPFLHHLIPHLRPPADREWTEEEKQTNETTIQGTYRGNLFHFLNLRFSSLVDSSSLSTYWSRGNRGGKNKQTNQLYKELNRGHLLHFESQVFFTSWFLPSIRLLIEGERRNRNYRIRKEDGMERMVIRRTTV